jgi:molybdenum cofactor cytidylyltransferase
MNTLVAVLLAAGGGTRFAGPGHKLLAVLDGRPVYRHALDAVREAGVGEVVVVTGAAELDLPPDVRSVHNPRWADGQATSLALGLDAAGTDPSVTHAIVGLADQPLVPPSAWRAVALATTDAPIVVATYDGRRGPNPVRLRRDAWALIARDGDEGARHLIRERPEWVQEVPCSGSPADIDTLEDLKRWTSS